MIDRMTNAAPHPRSVLATVLPVWLIILLFCYPVFLGKIPLNADLLLTTHPWLASNPNPILQNPEMDDPILQYYPFAAHAAAALRAGILPLWNPDIFCGMPQLGDTHSLPLDPLFLLCYLTIPNDATAWSVMLILHLLLLAFFSTGYLLSVRCSRLATRIAVTALVFSGPVTVWWQLRRFTAVLLWLFAALWMIERFRTSRHSTHALLTGVCLGFMLLGGHTQFLLYGWLLVGVTLITRWFFPADSDRLPFSLAASNATLAIVTGVLIGAPMILDTGLLMQNTFRGDPGRYHQIFTFGPGAWMSLIDPFFFGHPASEDYHGIFIHRRSYMNTPMMYVGMLPAAFALFALPDRRIRRHPLTIIAILIPLSLSVLAIPPVRRAIHAAWPNVFAIDPARLGHLLSPLAIILTAHGITLWESSSKRRRRLLMLWPAGVIAFFTCACLTLRLFQDNLAAMAGDNSYLLYFLTIHRAKGDLLLHTLRTIAMACAILLVPVIANLSRTPGIAMTGDGGGRQGGWPRTIPILLMALTLLDLIPFAARYVPFTSRTTLDVPARLSEAIRPGTRMIGVDSLNASTWNGSVLPPNTALLYGLSDFRGYVSSPPRVVKQVINAIEPHTYFDRRWNTIRSPWLDAFGVRYRLTDQQPRNLDDFSRVDLDGCTLYRSETAFRDAWLVVSARRMESIDQMVREVVSGKVDLATTVYLDDPESLTAGLPDKLNNHSMRFLTRTRHLREILVTLDTPAILVMNDQMYPGWEADIDGEPAGLFTADGLFRALRLEPGANHVRLRYRPLTALLGLFGLCLAGLLGGFALGGALRRKATP